ncbi:MAG: ATP cone domain-containing protein [Dehalococcoidia bacterium]
MSEKSLQDKSLQVRKCDGSLEPFVLVKLTNSIRNGLQAGGEAAGLDAGGGLAEAVHQYVRQSPRDEPVQSAYLAELVELVLTHTGHAAASMAMRRYRAFLEERRRRLMVASARSSDGRFVRRRWNKALIVQHLRRQHMLGAPVSRMIAGRVEQLIFNCGLKVVTSGLVYEMIKSELLAWGLLPGALVVKKTRRFREPGRVKDKTDSA